LIAYVVFAFDIGIAVGLRWFAYVIVPVALFGSPMAMGPVVNWLRIRKIRRCGRARDAERVRVRPFPGHFRVEVRLESDRLYGKWRPERQREPGLQFDLKKRPPWGMDRQAIAVAAGSA
jgi:hypothetical protein